jgi:stage II sporulation protein D
MKRLAFGAFLVLSAAACVSRPVAPAIPAAEAALPRHVRVQFVEQGVTVVRDVPLEEYVRATAISEVAPAAGEFQTVERMLEVQTIISRTYAVSHLGRHAREGFDLCSTTHCQLYEPARLHTSRWAQVVRDAVQRTSGELLWWADGPARAVYHADCGGHTSNAAAVWGGIAPAYLAGATDKVAAGAAHTDWTFETRAAALRSALNADPRTAVGARLDRIEIAARDEAGRAEKILLRGSRTFLVRGEVFREVVTRALGVKSIRSTLFSLKQSGTTFVFSGKGFGHGVGLCQAGAFARLRAGDSPEDVLEHYFPGTSLHR